MPKVPYQGVSEQPLRPLAQERISSAGVTALAFGGGAAAGYQAVGEDLGNVSQDVTNIALDIQHRDAERAARDAMTSLSAYQRDKMYGTDGYFGKNGQDAVDAQAGAAQQLTEFRQKTAEGLSDQARQLFDPSSINQTNNTLNNMASHAYKERDNADRASWKTAGIEANNQAAANPRDPKVLGNALAVAGTMAANISKADGNKPEVIAADRKTAETGVYLSAIESLIRRDSATDARVFYNGVKGNIDGEIQLKIEDRLDTADKDEQTVVRLQQTAARQAQNDFEEQEALRLIDLGDQLTPQIIRDSGASSTAQTQFLNHLNAKADGGGTIKNNPDAYFEVARRMRAGAEDPITSPDQILAYVVPGGITIDTAGTYINKLTKSHTPEVDSFNASVTGHIDAISKVIGGKNLAGFNDPLAPQSMADYDHTLRERVQKELKDGTATMQEMTNPDSEFYFDKLVPPPVPRSTKERVKSMSELSIAKPPAITKQLPPPGENPWLQPAAGPSDQEIAKWKAAPHKAPIEGSFETLADLAYAGKQGWISYEQFVKYLENHPDWK